jgi:RHS repeat-associated protein
MGYDALDLTRQRFTSKERDQENRLDYFLARYYSSAQGRFVSVDPNNAGSIFDDPQSWNGYAYARSNPLLFVDPDGRLYVICGANGVCGTITDQEFRLERDTFRRELGSRLTFTGNSRGFYESGDIYSAQGEYLASYQQISIDDRAEELAYEVRQRFSDPKTYIRAAVNAVLGAAELRARIRSRRGAAPAIDDKYHPDAVRDRVRPPYRPNPAHDPGTLNPRKTPEPPDAPDVYSGAVRGGMGEWYGRNTKGEIYQFFSDNAGGVHFAGKLTVDQLRQKSPDVARQLGY